MTELITQLPSGTDTLRLAGDFPVNAARLFAYWTERELLRRWWPPQAEVVPEVGGSYRFGWPTIERELHGAYSRFEPGRWLEFTWQWEQESDVKTVLLEFAARSATETRLVLTHGPYADSMDDQDVRVNHHMAGWNHFLPKLYQAVQSEDAHAPV